MRVRVTLTLETEMKVSINVLQALFGNVLSDDLQVKVEGIAVADDEDKRRAEGYCPDCGRTDKGE